MSSRLTALGTSAAWPHPRPGCDCEGCQEARTPGRRRTRSSLLVECGPDALLIDAGPDLAWQLEALGRLPSLAAVAITHVHADHYLGIFELHLLPSSGDLPLYAHPNNEPALRSTFGFAFAPQGPLAFCPAEPGRAFDFADGQVIPFNTNHTDEFTTLGYLLRLPDRTIAYSPDFKSLDRRGESLLAGIDGWIVDGSGLDTAYPSHATMVEILATATCLGIGNVWFTHIGHLRRAEATMRADLAAAVRNDLAGVGFLRDGDVL